MVNITRKRSLRSITIMGLRGEDSAVLAQGEIQDAAGSPLKLEELGEQEVYLNKAAAEALEAAPGDELEIYVSNRPKVFTVKGIAAQGDDSRLMISLRQAQVLFNQRGKINLMVVSNDGDPLGGVEHSEDVTAHLRGLLSDPTVTAQVFSFLRRDPAVIQALLHGGESGRRGSQRRT